MTNARDDDTRRGSTGTWIIIGAMLLIAVIVGLWRPWVGEIEIPDVVVDDMQPPVREVINEARAKVQEDPDSFDAWLALATVLDAHQQYLEARVCYEQALELQPGHLFATYNHALCLELTGVPAEGLALFEQVAAADPKYADAAVHFRIGEAHFREGRNPEAAAAFQRVLDYQPGSAVALRRLGQVSISLDEIDRAIEALEAVRKVAPNDRSTLTALAQAYARSGNRDRAKEIQETLSTDAAAADTLALKDSVRHAVTVKAMDSASCLARARTAEQQGQFPEAIRELEIAARGRPDRAVLRDRIGRNYIRMQRYRDAIAQFDQALGIDPGYANSYHNRALAWERLGNRERAIADYRRALRIDPDHELAAEHLRRLGETP